MAKKVVEHEVGVEGLLHRAIDAAQEAQELLRAVPRLTFADDEAAPDVQRREQGCFAVT